jgi:hypothetical protein
MLSFFRRKPKFPIDRLLPANGECDALIFENSHIALRRTLFFNIRVNLAPFPIKGATVNTCLALDWIELPYRGWYEFRKSELRFPENPKPGYIDASVYLFNVHVPVFVSEIRFSDRDGDRIRADVRSVIEFASQHLGYLDAEYNFSVDLKFSPLRIYGDLSPRVDSEKDAINVAANFTDVSRYHHPVKNDRDQFAFRPRLED